MVTIEAGWADPHRNSFRNDPFSDGLQLNFRVQHVPRGPAVVNMSTRYLVNYQDDPGIEGDDQSPDSGDLVSRLPPSNIREADVVLSILYSR